MADDGQRNISQICELLLHEGVEAYKKEGAKFMRRLVAKAIQNDRQQILAASLLQSGNELLQFTFRFFH